MAALDWSQCAAVESIPGKVSGAWVFKGTRMPVAAIFENLEAGASIDDIMQWPEGLDREQVVIEFAVRSLDRAPSTPLECGLLSIKLRHHRFKLISINTKSAPAEQGWATFKNGDLPTAAEAAGFEVVLTTDKNLQYQQNLKDRSRHS